MYTMQDVSKIRIHWSESSYLNKKYGVNENHDIEKEVSLDELHSQIMLASMGIDIGYDKTMISIIMNDGFAYQFRMDICEDDCNLNFEVERRLERISAAREKVENSVGVSS